MFLKFILRAFSALISIVVSLTSAFTATFSKYLSENIFAADINYGVIIFPLNECISIPSNQIFRLQVRIRYD